MPATNQLRGSAATRFRTFADYAEAGFTANLLPIAHPQTPLSPTSSLKPHQLGKVPCERRSHGCVGFQKFTQHVSTPDNVALYDTWRADPLQPWGLGLQGRSAPGFDIDEDRPDLANAFQELAASIVAPAPARHVYDASTGVAGARRMLAYRSTEPLRPWTVAYELDGAKGMIELKAQGQQWVAEGVHKSGGLYGWRSGKSPADVGYDALPEMTSTTSEALRKAAVAMIESRGGKVLAGTSGAVSSHSAANQADLLAPSLEAIRTALAVIPNDLAYIDWIRALAAIKAAAGEEAEDMYGDAEDWSAQWDGDIEGIRAKWTSLKPPFRAGWPHIKRLAKKATNGAYRAPVDEFGPRVLTTAAPASERQGTAADEMFQRYAWVHSRGLPLDLETGELLKKEVFNAANYRVGDPASVKESAWAVFLRDGDRRQVAQSLTFRPGEGLWVSESVSGLTGICINTWRPMPPLSEEPVSDAEVRPWLDVAEHLMPEPAERAVVLNWLGFVIQRQADKPNFGIVMGSSYEGVGKDMFLDPMRAAIGGPYVREIKPHQLASQFSGYLKSTKLLIVQEMHSFQRREVANTLKPLLAAPPPVLPVELKGRDPYYTPNIVAVVFCTNEENALHIDQNSRRYYVTWCTNRPKPPAFYASLRRWLDDGGNERVARYLMQRDLSGFDPKALAPPSAGRDAMRRASRTKLEEFVEDGILNAEGPFATNLVALEDLLRRIPEEVVSKYGRPSPEALMRLLKKFHATRIDKLALGKPPLDAVTLSGQARESVVYALRDPTPFLDLEKRALRDAFWRERIEVARLLAASAG